MKTWLYLFSCLILFSTLWVDPAPCSSNEYHKVFIVHSYEAGNVCGQPQASGILDGLSGQGFVVGKNLQLKQFYMDTKRTYTAQKQIASQGKAALAAIDAWQPDVVVTLDDNAATQVMLPLVDSNVSVVFSGINNLPEFYNLQKRFMESRQHPGHNITGVYEKLHIAKSFQVMKDILPDFDRVVIIVDNSPTGRAIRKQAERELAGNTGDILYSFWQARDFSEYKRMIQRINSSDTVDAYYPACSQLKEEAGGIATVPEIISWTLGHATKPAMAVNFSFSRLGLLGGASVNFPAMGRQAALKIAALFNGVDAGTLPIEDADDYALVFNMARTRQLGLSIPADLLGAVDEVYDTMELGGPLVQPKIFILHSEGKEGDISLLEQGILLAMEKAGWVAGRNFALYHYFLYAGSTLSREQIHRRGLQALSEINRLQPDGVVLLGDAASSELMSPLIDLPYAVIFGDVHAPLSFYGLKVHPVGENLFLKGNVTGVSSPFHYEKSLEILQMMQPRARQLVIISSDIWPWMVAITNKFSFLVNTTKNKGVLSGIDFRRVSTFEEFKKEVLRADSDPDVDMMSVLPPYGLTRADGSIVSLKESFNWLIDHQHKPGFTCLESQVRFGFLVAAASSPEKTGEQIGRQLIRVLAGDKPATIPVEYSMVEIYLNQARARQVGVEIPVEIFEAAQQVYTEIKPESVP